MKWFDYENQEKGYQPFELTKENIKANKGRKIVYVCRVDVDSRRGYCFPRYGYLFDKHYSLVRLADKDGIFRGQEIDGRDVIECGIWVGEES